MNYTKSNNTYFATPKEDAKDRIKLEIGDSKQTEFFPQVKILRWDNEVNFSVRLKHGELAPTVSKVGEKITWKGSKVEAHFYDIPDGEGASEFEVVLKEKPVTNRVEFTINTKGLDFFYQPPLTQDEINTGAVRPENVVGSYAVYTSENKVNYEGGKLYKSGKVGHIYRPKIVDANGIEVWGDLNIDAVAGLLSVTIPQGFLDTAAYPVRHAAGLTMGYTAAGGTSPGQFTNANDAFFSKGTATPGTVSSVSFYAGNRLDPGSANVKAAIWKVSDKVLIGNSAAHAFAGLAPDGTANPTWGMVTWTQTISALDYYIGVIQEANGAITVRYDAGAAGDGGWSANNYTTPANLGTITDNTRKHSVYATYTAAAATGNFFAFF